MKLRQKPEESGAWRIPFLQLELRDRLTVHEIPIKLLKTAYWPKYQRPDLPNSMMGIYFPPVKSVMKVLHSLKNVTNKNITLKVSNSGEMHLKCLVEHADITVYFTNLMNDTMTEEQSQEQWYTVRVPLKVVHMFFAGFMYMAHFNVLLNIVSDSYAEFTLRRDGLVVSFLVRGINDVY
ncbi:Hus1-like protein [Cooperia oncophora]